MTPVYSRDGSADFNERLNETLLRIGDEVEQALGNNLVTLVLGGGYGRGEGGLVVKDGKEMPYNDLDLTLVVGNKSTIPRDRLKAIEKKYAKELGIHVDFSRPLTVRDVENWPRWLMWYDLINGYVALKGGQELLASLAPATLKEPLPVIEATRLLLNRGTGLLWAFRVVRKIEQAPDDDFIRRNYYKCSLALGDALLIAYQRFTTKYWGRDDLLADLELAEPKVGSFGLQSLYREALRFKFRPDQINSDIIKEEDLKALAKLWGTIFLHVEMVRTGLVWSSLDDYVNWKGIREKDQHALPMIFRNIARNLQMGRWSWRYPRETLYKQLPVLLGLVSANVENWAEETKEFLRIWNRFN